jgi:hypothetical protein
MGPSAKFWSWSALYLAPRGHTFKARNLVVFLCSVSAREKSSCGRPIAKAFAYCTAALFLVHVCFMASLWRRLVHA